MKKILSLLLLSFFVFNFTSCKSDDDGPNEQPFSIVGSWKISGKLINGVSQDISTECVYNGRMSFINGGIYTEDIYAEDSENPCHLAEIIGGNWQNTGNNYTITVSTPGVNSVLPASFTIETESGNYSEFRISATSLGTTTTLVFSKL